MLGVNDMLVGKDCIIKTKCKTYDYKWRLFSKLSRNRSFDDYNYTF